MARSQPWKIEYGTYARVIRAEQRAIARKARRNDVVRPRKVTQERKAGREGKSFEFRRLSDECARSRSPYGISKERDSRVPNSGVFFRVVEKALSRFAKANDLLEWGTVAFRTCTLWNTVKTECEFEVYLVANGREPYSSVCRSQACYFRETSERTA